MFYFDKIDGKRILKSDLVKNAQAFFTTRDICICDKGINISPSPLEGEGWGEGAILKNQKLLTDYLNITPENLISPIQTHSSNIEIAKPSQKEYPDTDGLILTEKNLAIFLNFADCTPIILYDEKQNIGAISHAGWRGTAGKIGRKTVEKMTENCGTNPKDIIALIGPAIGFCCYEVGEDVYNQLSKTVSDFNGLYEIREGKIFVDLKNINKRQLEEAGVEKIDVCPYCTVHNNDLFYSYRNENRTTLRHSAVLKL